MKKLLVMFLFTVAAFAQGSGHTVTLTCTASTTLGVTYNFLRSTTSGGPYSIINLSPTSICSFTDTQVTAGTTYYYVAQSYDGVSFSVNSNQVTAVIPSAPAPPTNLTVTVK